MPKEVSVGTIVDILNLHIIIIIMFIRTQSTSTGLQNDDDRVT